MELHHHGHPMPPLTDAPSISESSDDEHEHGDLPQTAIAETSQVDEDNDPLIWRKWLVRAIALICAMSLSIGSHLYVSGLVVIRDIHRDTVAGHTSWVPSSPASRARSEPRTQSSH